MIEMLIQMPTGLVSIFMLIVLVYWIFVILGALDIGMFDGAGDAVTESTAESAGGLLNALNLRSAPVTIVFSFITFYTWIFCLFLSSSIVPLGPAWLMALLTLSAGLVVSFVLTSVSIRPLAPVFESDHAQKRSDLIGKVCVVSTGKVNETFGQATVTQGDLLIQVRCDRGDDAFNKGDRALIIDYDEDAEAFLIEPLDPMMYG